MSASHNLTIKRIRFREVNTIAWCSCGEWKYEDMTLSEADAVRAFVAHLPVSKREEMERKGL